MDRLVVGVVLGPTAVSLVEIATQVMNGADAVLSAMSYAVVPSAAWLSARQDHRTLRELLHRGTKYSLFVTWPVAAGAAILAGPLVRVWVGGRYEAAAGLAAVALLAEMVAAPVQVGSNLLLGVGRATDILKAAGIAIVANLALSVVLFHVTGIVGVFQATLIATAVMVPLLLPAILRAVDTTLSSFLREAVVPLLPPLAALGVALGIVVALDLPDVTTLVAGTLAGGVAYVLVALRWTVHRDEFAEFRALARRAAPAG
jgi:O-antigen/teichoic acid export membrane protein